MKKYIALLLFFAIFALSAYQDMQKGHKQNQKQAATTKALTITDVHAAFEQDGLPLEAWENSQRFYKLNSEVPAFYKADSGEFAIYVFQSDIDRVKGREDFDNQTATAKVALSNIYEVRNVLIFEFRQPIHYERMQQIIDALYGTAKPEILSIEDVKAALHKQGIELKSSEFKYEWFKLGLKTEYSFDVNGKEQLYVYVFDSANDVEKGLKQINIQNALFDISYTPTPYMINNVLIMYMRYLPMSGVENNIQTAVGTLNGQISKIEINEPPMPRINVEGMQVAIVRGSSCWAANGMGKCVDMVSPPELVKKVIPTVATAGSKAMIQFDYVPSESGVNQWGSEGTMMIALEQGNTFRLPQVKGIYVYDVYGRWKEGSSSFAFSVEVK